MPPELMRQSAYQRATPSHYTTEPPQLAPIVALGCPGVHTRFWPAKCHFSRAASCHATGSSPSSNKRVWRRFSSREEWSPSDPIEVDLLYRRDTEESRDAEKGGASSRVLCD